MSIIIGIDPGKNGAATVLDFHGRASFFRLSYDDRNFLDTDKLLSWIKSLERYDAIFIEKVQGHSNSGTNKGAFSSFSMFNLGVSYGQLLGSISTIISTSFIKLVPPQTWQARLHKGLSRELKAKERSLLAYQNLYPDLPIKPFRKGGKPHDGVVDSLLIATYGKLILEEETLK